MSYTAITSGEIASGEPNKNDTWTKVKDNFVDHETRIESLEGATAVYGPIIFRVNGRYGLAGAVTSLLKTTINFSLTVTGIRVLIDKAGTSGTTEVDILRSRSGGAYVSLLSTKPSVLYSAGDDALSTNAILNPSNVNLLAGDILRLDQTSAQPDGESYLVRIDFNRGS
jgi:hypothetical protein